MGRSAPAHGPCSAAGCDERMRAALWLEPQPRKGERERPMAWYHADVMRGMPVAESVHYTVGRLTTVGQVMRDGVRRALRSSATVPTAIPGELSDAEAIGYHRYRPKPYDG